VFSGFIRGKNLLSVVPLFGWRRLRAFATLR